MKHHVFSAIAAISPRVQPMQKGTCLRLKTSPVKDLSPQKTGWKPLRASTRWRAIHAQMKDPERNGDRDWMGLLDHLIEDSGHCGPVLWGWNPGNLALSNKENG